MSNLINSAADLKSNFGTIDANINWPNFQPSVDDVERDIIGAVIGADSLNWFRDNLATQDATQQQALVYLQRATAYLAVHQWSQTSAFRLTDKALYLTKGTDGIVPSDKKLTDLRGFLEETGNNFLDKALTVMEGSLDQFPLYADSGVRASNRQAFVETAAQFSYNRNINNSRLTFLSMVQIMLDVQDEFLPAYMTPAYYALFKERYLDDELSAGEQALLLLVQKAVVMLTVAQACKDLPVKIKGAGLFVNRYNNSIDYQMQDPANADQVGFISADCREKGERFLKMIGDYMLANAASLPGYVAPVQERIDVNFRESGFFFVN